MSGSTGWLGRSLPRKEDLRILRGKGTYVDDLRVEQAVLSVAFVRCPHARARIMRIDTSEARSAPGVVGVFTGDDLGEFNRPMPVLYGNKSGLEKSALPLASETICYSGEAVAVVVAESRYQAEDGADLVRVEYEPGEALVDLETAASTEEVLVHPDRPGNLAAEAHQTVGDPQSVFREAPYVSSLTLRIHRGSAQPMEPRGILVQPVRGAGGSPVRLEVWSSTQRPHAVRMVLAQMLGLEEEQIHVRAPDIGGGFGVKLYVYPEEVVTAWLALKLNRPVRWTEDRREHFLSAMHERDQIHRLEVAYDEDGRMLALRDDFLHDTGAYAPYGAAVMYNAFSHIPGPYRVPHLELRARSIFTNQAPTGPYRGAGRPQGCYVMERVIDHIARERGLDQVEVRRRNLLRPEELPHRTGIVSGTNPVEYDSGDYPAALEMALEAVDAAGFRRRQEAAWEQGRYLGLGVAVYNEACGTPPFEGARATLTAEGRFRVYTGSTPQGQGHVTTFAQIFAEEMGVTPDQVDVVCGDTEGIPKGIGTFGSRSVMLGGSATGLAARALRARLIELAAQLLEASPADLVLDATGVSVRGAPSRRLSLRRLAEAARGDQLDVVHYQESPNNSWSYGAQAVVVEADPETGDVRVIDSRFVHDCGNVVNPQLVEGQVIGGVAQAIGNALLERIVYDGSGQLTTASFMDYLMPTAMEVPETRVLHMYTPTTLNPYGFKGAGESGVMPTAAAVAQAVEDALRPWGVCITDVPLSPESLRRQIAAAMKPRNEPDGGGTR